MTKQAQKAIEKFLHAEKRQSQRGLKFHKNGSDRCNRCQYLRSRIEVINDLLIMVPVVK